MQFDRKNKNLFKSWWWTVDRITMLTILFIVLIGALLVATSSPAVAERIGLNPFYFLQRQLVHLLFAILLIFSISLMNPVFIRRFAILGFIACIILMIIVLLVGSEAKGARRWLYLFGFSLQPSEFIKPFFAVLTAWVLALKYNHNNFPGFRISIFLYIIVILLLVLQPDFGMVITVSSVWVIQFFVAGISIFWIFLCAFCGLAGILFGYLLLPHVKQRIDAFLNPSGSDTYQVRKSMEAFNSGGLTGHGPGEGTVKQFIPDSHTDFIFAVMGEELGVIACSILVALFSIVIIRSLIRIRDNTDLFTLYAVTGLIAQFGIQAIINMGVALHLLPTKGMTLPFISYGGSSTFAIAIAIGMVLGLTKTRYGVNYHNKIRKNY